MTDDEKLIKSMFDEVIETSIKPDGEVEVKLVSPSAEEMEEAQADFLQAEKRFRELNSHPDVATDMGLCVRWWNAMERLYVTEKYLWQLFCGEERPSPQSTALYLQYRERLIRRSKGLYRPNA